MQSVIQAISNVCRERQASVLLLAAIESCFVNTSQSPEVPSPPRSPFIPTSSTSGWREWTVLSQKSEPFLHPAWLLLDECCSLTERQNLHPEVISAHSSQTILSSLCIVILTSPSSSLPPRPYSSTRPSEADLHEFTTQPPFYVYLKLVLTDRLLY